MQDTQVLARDASAAGMAHGCIAVRLGRLLVYLEDRDALTALTTAAQKAAALEQEAFGRRRAPVYRPRDPMRR